jgi:hypothetical protein
MLRVLTCGIEILEMRLLVPHTATAMAVISLKRCVCLFAHNQLAYPLYVIQSSYANNGRTTRFHPSGYGRKSCPWKDTILPISYLVFISHSLRKLFAPYDIPGINFMNPSQTDFLTWFMNTENADCLPPALFILYVIKNEFGMPPPLPQDPKPADIDPFA